MPARLELPQLPILEALPALRDALAASSRAVLQAAPGAGKTTVVPVALLHEPWLAGQRILLLEPRRLAARAAAQQMSRIVRDDVGGLVGYRVRGDTRIGKDTRIEVVTEGILTRMLTHDPTLDGTGALLFDEFHERSIHADTGLALALESQRELRPELRILIMSATLDAQSIATLLGNASVVTSVNRAFPVDIRYRASPRESRVEDNVARAVVHALSEHDGDVLAFLPGAREIQRCADTLARSALPAGTIVLPLFGDLSPAAQDAAIAPSVAGVRKVVLASAIAETSITIDGVRVVVDGGLARISRFSPRTGMARLETVRVTLASANQRAGRAGRTSPGICYRLWPHEEDTHLLAHVRPEILDADLTPLALDLARAGIGDANTLSWLDTPPAAGLSSARGLLRQLDCLDANDRITETGRIVASLGVHPRLGRMLVAAKARGFGATACAIAALLEERDIMRSSGMTPDVDISTRIDALSAHSSDVPAAVDRGALHRVRTRYRDLRSQLRVPSSENADASNAGALLALGYPDRVAMQRSGRSSEYLLRSGAGASLPSGSALAREQWLAVAELDGKVPRSGVRLCAPLVESEVREMFAASIETERETRWFPEDGVVRSMRRERLGAIILREVLDDSASPDDVAEALLDGIMRGDSLDLTWSSAAMQLRQRIAFMHAQDASWPDVSDSALLSSAREWLAPHLDGLRKRADVERLPLHDILLSVLTWQQRALLDAGAPARFALPGGRTVAIDYSDPAAPSIAVRIQHLFGVSVHPVAGSARIPLVVDLLSPAQRTVQVTRDLPGFWRGSYAMVRKEMKGRYPKHAWPEDPSLV